MVLITIVTGAFVNQRSHHNGGPHIVPSSVIAIAEKCRNFNERTEIWEIHSMNFKLMGKEGILRKSYGTHGNPHE